MALQQSDWEAAAKALDAVVTHNDVELETKRRLQNELALAIEGLKVALRKLQAKAGLDAVAWNRRRQIEYDEAVRRYRERDASAARVFAEAEAVARRGAVVLGYVPPPVEVSGEAGLRDFFYPQHYRFLVRRLLTLEQLPGFAENEYGTAVVRPTLRALLGAEPPYAPPVKPQQAVAADPEVGSDPAVVALKTAIGNVNEFVAGCNAGGL